MASQSLNRPVTSCVSLEPLFLDFVTFLSFWWLCSDFLAASACGRLCCLSHGCPFATACKSGTAVSFVLYGHLALRLLGSLVSVATLRSQSTSGMLYYSDTQGLKIGWSISASKSEFAQSLYLFSVTLALSVRFNMAVAIQFLAAKSTGYYSAFQQHLAPVFIYLLLILHFYLFYFLFSGTCKYHSMYAC